MSNPELVATIEEKFNDPLSPTMFSVEVAEYLGKFEDLEGDGALIAQKLQAGIEREVARAMKNGDISQDSAFKMNFVVRDPSEGDVALVFQTSARLNEDGTILVENDAAAHVVNEELELVNTSFSSDCMDLARQHVGDVMEGLGLNDASHDFMKENTDNYTYSVLAFTPVSP